MYITEMLQKDDVLVYKRVSKEEAEELKNAGIKVLTYEDYEADAFDEQADSPNKDDSTKRLIKILPFLSKQDLSEMIDRIIDGAFDLPISDKLLYPFADQKDRDRLFLHKLSNQASIANLIPFVSRAALSQAVDMIIDGQLDLTVMDKYYPFLSKEDVKRLFEYALKLREEPTDGDEHQGDSH